MLLLYNLLSGVAQKFSSWYSFQLHIYTILMTNLEYLLKFHFRFLLDEIQPVFPMENTITRPRPVLLKSSF